MYPPLCGSGWTLCVLVLAWGVPIPQAVQAGPEGLRCICRCVGVAGPCLSSFSHGASLSPKRPKQDRRDSGVSAVVWEWLDPMCPRSRKRHPYPPSGRGRTGGTRVHPLLCKSGSTSCILVLPRGVPIPQAAQVGVEGLGCIRRCVGVAGPCVSSLSQGAAQSPNWPEQARRNLGVSAAVWERLGPLHTSFSHGASLSPERPRQDRRNSGVSAAVLEWLDPVCPHSPTGRPYPPSGPSRTGGTRVYPPLCGSGQTLCVLVLARGIPIPQAAEAGQGGFGCIRRCVGVARHCVPSFSHGTSLSPKRPK